MKTKRILFLTIVLVLAMSAVSVEAASTSTAVNQPWTTGVVKAGVTNISNLSTAFVGANEIPMLSYAVTTTPKVTKIYQAHLATSVMPGNCGPSNTWFCTDWNAGASFYPGTLSNMATERYGATTFGLKWAYQNGAYIRGTTNERYNDMSLVGAYNSEDLIQLSKFGGGLAGAPSLVMDGGHFQMAAIIQSGGDFPTLKLVYMHYTGNTPKTSCIDTGTVYQCDVIEEAIGYGSISSPSLQVAPDGTVGIAYYYGRAVKYAYPHTDSVPWPSNCGPGGNTWRCISIFSGTPTGTVGPVVKFAFGATGSNRGIAFTYDDTLIEKTLYNATYVGSGGNCGADFTSLGATVSKWRCTDVVIVAAATYTPSFSIAVDPQGYSVMSYDIAPEEFSPVFLYITYPNARTGSAAPGWTAQKIDGAPVTEVSTGALAALSFNSAGIGFMGYLQATDYGPTDLRFALQHFQIALPLVLH